MPSAFRSRKDAAKKLLKQKEYASRKVTLKPFEDDVQTKSPLVMGTICILYMCFSSSLTLINKTIYEKYGFKSPMNLFMV